MVSSSSLCKNKEVLAKNGGGKWKLFISCVGNMSLLNMTLVCSSCRVGISSLCHFASMGLGNPFSCHSITNFVNMTSDPIWVKCCQIPESCCRYVQEKTLLQFVHSLILCCSLDSHSYYIHCFVSMMCDSLWPSFDGSLPVDFSSFSRNLI